MKNIIISDLLIYPIKSSKGIQIDEIKVLETGFEFDRHFAVVNSENKIITARENPRLLQIRTSINKNEITLFNDKETFLTINTTNTTNDTASEITLFKKGAYGKFVDKNADIWLSNTLLDPCKLIHIDSQNLRKNSNKTISNKLAFTDAYPIHIVTGTSMKHLNSILETPINDNRFRPNIIISGTEKPYEEYLWKSITIGTCEFDVIEPTERCSLITINPSTLERDSKQEPLRTLAKNKTVLNKVAFGMYLIPKNKGTIKKTDTIKVTL